MVLEGKNIDLALKNENEGGNGGASPGLVDSGINIPNTISNPNTNVNCSHKVITHGVSLG